MQLGGPGDGRKRRRKTIKEQEEEKLKDFDEVSVVSGNTDANEYNRGYYGNKHYATKRSIEQSLDRMRQDYTKGNYVRTDDGSWDYDKSYAAEANYDSDVEDLFRRYNEIENQMYLNFGDRKGDPTKAKDWMNSDGRLYRKRLRALESDIQDLFLRRQEKRGDLTGTTKVNAEGVANQFTRVPLRDKEFIQEEVSREGYVPRKYQLNFEDMVVYPTDALKKKQEKLSAKAEELFMEGMREGYGPSSAVPIGGSIEQLQKFIKDQKSNFKDFKKDRAELEKQSAKDASYIGVSTDDLGTDAGYAALRKKMKENPNDGGLITIYRKHFQPLGYGVTQQLTEKERQQAELAFRGFTGNDRLDAIMDPTRAATNAALATAYAPAAAWSAPAFFNPTIQNILAPYFAYEAVKPDGILDQAVDEFAKGEYLSGTIDAGFGLLDVFAIKGLMETLKTPGAVEKLFSKLKSRNLPKGYLEKINNELPPMLRLDNIDDIPRSLSVPSVTKVPELGPGQRSIPESSDQLIAADLIEGMDDADIPLDVNEALVKLTDEQFKQVTGTDKWVYQMLVEKDPASAARTFKTKVDNAKMNSGVATLNSAEPFNKVAQEGNMPFTDILKVKTAANDGKQKAIDWVSSDQFLQRVVDSRGVSIDEAKQIQAEFLDNIDRIPLELKAYDENARVRGALTSNEVGEVVIRAHAPKVEGFDSSNQMVLDDLTGTIEHEYLHAANLASGKNMKGIEFLPDLKIPEGAKPIVRKNIAYLNKYPEQQVRAVKAIQLAQEAGIIKANEKFTEASLNKLRDYVDEEGWLFGIPGYKDLPLLLDPVRTGKTIKDKDVVNLLNTAYQYVLPIAGTAALAASSDEDTEGMSAAAIPLLAFGKNAKGAKAFKNAIKTVRNFFMRPRQIATGIKYTSQSRLAEVANKISLNDIDELKAILKKMPEEAWDDNFANIDHFRKVIVRDINNLRKIKAGIKPEGFATEGTIGRSAIQNIDEVSQQTARSVDQIKNLLKQEEAAGEISQRAMLKDEADMVAMYDKLIMNPGLNAIWMKKYANELKKFASLNIKNPKQRELFLDELDNIVEESITEVLSTGTRQKIFRETLDERVEILRELATSGTYKGKRSMPKDKIKFLFGVNNLTESNTNPLNRMSSKEIYKIVMNGVEKGLNNWATKDGELNLDNPILKLPFAGSNLEDAQRAGDNWLIRNLSWAEKEQENFKLWDESIKSGWSGVEEVFPKVLNEDFTWSDVVSEPQLFESMMDKLNQLVGKQTTSLDKKIKAIEDLKRSDIQKEGTGLIQTGPLSKFFGANKPLTAGESQIENLKTGAAERVNVARGSGEKVSIKRGELVREVFGDGSKPIASENLAPALKENVQFIEETTGGKVFGSSQLAAMGVPTIPGDYDILITEGNMLKNVIPNETINTDLVDLNSPYAQKLKIQGADTDFMIIKNGPDGLVEAKFRSNGRSVEEELFRQFFPKEYDKAVKDKTEAIIDAMADKGRYAPKSIKLKIPLTAEELIAGVDPEVKSILDAFAAGSSQGSSIKAKHTLKADAVLLFANPEKVIKAQELYIKSVAGPNAKVAPDFIEYFKNASVEDNLNLLINAMDNTDDVFISGETAVNIAKDPVRMQAFLNDWYINNTTTSRQVNIEGIIDVLSQEVKTGESFSVTNKNIIDALTVWNKVGGGGGSAAGAGLNVGVGIGDTGWSSGATSAVVGFAQYKFPDSNIKTPEDLINTIKVRTRFETKIPENLKNKIETINKKYGVDGTRQRYETLGDLMQKSMYEFSSRQLEWVEWYKEIGKALNTPFIRSMESDGRGGGQVFGNLRYAGGTNQWENLGQSIGFSFLEDIESMKSLLDRKRALRKNSKTFAINTKEDFYKIKNLFDMKLKELEDKRRAFLNARDKASTNFTKAIDKASRLKASDSVKKVKEVYSELIKFANKVEAEEVRLNDLYLEAQKVDAGRKKFKYVLKPWVELAIGALGIGGVSSALYWIEDIQDYLDPDGDGQFGTNKKGNKDVLQKYVNTKKTNKNKFKGDKIKQLGGSVEIELDDDEVQDYIRRGYTVEEID